MTQRMSTRTPREDPLPARWRALVNLLEEKPGLTIKEIASELGDIKMATAYSYLSAVSNVVPIRGEGPYGGMRYYLVEATGAPTTKEIT